LCKGVGFNNSKLLKFAEFGRHCRKNVDAENPPEKYPASRKSADSPLAGKRKKLRVRV
jgi:hypothetical protein